MKKRPVDITELLREPINTMLQLATPILLVVFLATMIIVLNIKYPERLPVRIISFHGNNSGDVLLGEQYRNMVRIGQDVSIVAHNKLKKGFTELQGHITSIRPDAAHWSTDLQVTISLDLLPSKETNFSSYTLTNGFMVSGYKKLADQFFIKKLINF